jgi:hypothetical protein
MPNTENVKRKTGMESGRWKTRAVSASRTEVCGRQVGRVAIDVRGVGADGLGSHPARFAVEDGCLSQGTVPRRFRLAGRDETGTRSPHYCSLRSVVSRDGIDQCQYCRGLLSWQWCRSSTFLRIRVGFVTGNHRLVFQSTARARGCRGGASIPSSCRDPAPPADQHTTAARPSSP